MAKYQMSDAEKNKLRGNRVNLVKNVMPSEDLLSYLVQEKVLNEDMKEEIEAEKTRSARVGRLLDILPRRGVKAFEHFVYGLLDSDQPDVARLLDEGIVAEWESKQPPPEPRGGKPRANVPHHLRQKHVSRTQQNFVSSSKNPCAEIGEETGMLNPPVIEINEKDKTIMDIIANHKDYYKMSSRPRGRAVIINNSYFVNQAQRDGAQFDSMNLCSHLDQLYFETVLYDDLTAQDIKDCILEESQREDLHNADCSLVFILSHGSQGYIYGIDGCRVSIQDDIVTPFDGDHCRALLDKPKMFFIQACQGERSTEGVDAGTEGDSQVDAVPVQESQLEEAFRNLRVQDNENSYPRLGSSHEKSDIVLAYSTVPGYRSWRRTDLGSWFVRAVIKVFAAEAHKEDLLSLLVKVRSQVAENRTLHEDNSFMQLTRTDETTRKKIHFLPGYYEINRGDTV